MEVINHMIDASILQNFSDDDFAAKAFADYLDDVSENYASLLAIIQEVVDADPIVDENEDVDATLDDAQVSEIISNAGANGSYVVSLPQGYTTLSELCLFLRHKALDYADVETQDPVSALTGSYLELRDEEGALQSSLKTTYVDALADIKATMHSIVCSASAAYASLETNVADRLVVFKERVSKVFSNTYDDLSNFASSCRNLLSNATAKASDVCRSLIDTFQALDRPAKLEDTTVYHYTGAVPIAAVDYSVAKKVVVSTAKVIGQGIKTIFKALYDKLGQLGTKVAKKVYTAIDPVNLEVISNDEAAVPSINQFEFEFTRSAVTLAFSPAVTSTDSLNAFLSQHAGEWMKYKFVLGEVLFRYDSGTAYNSGGITLTGLNNPVFKIKPYVCDANRLHRAIYLATGLSASQISDQTYMYEFENNVTVEQVIELIQLLEEDDSLYLTSTDLPTGETVDAWNRKLMNDLSLSVALLISLLHLGGIEMAKSYASQTFAASKYTNVVFRKFLTSADIANNLEFAIGSSGYYNYTTQGGESKTAFIIDCLPERRAAVASGDLPGNVFADGAVPDTTQSVNLIYELMGAYMLQAYDRAVNPLNYVFLPYRAEKEGFDKSSLHVRSDEENQAAFTKLCNTVVAVVIAVAVVAVAGTIIRKIVRRAHFRKAQFIGQMDNKMWSSTGTKAALTAKEQRKYLRYTRKLNASSLISDSIQSSSSNTASSLVSNLYDHFNQGEATSFGNLVNLIAK